MYFFPKPLDLDLTWLAVHYTGLDTLDFLHNCGESGVFYWA